MCYNIASVVFKATELYELPSFFDCKSCGLFPPQPEIKPTPPALEVLTIASPGKSSK